MRLHRVTINLAPETNTARVRLPVLITTTTPTTTATTTPTTASSAAAIAGVIPPAGVRPRIAQHLDVLLGRYRRLRTIGVAGPTEELRWPSPPGMVEGARWERTSKREKGPRSP